MKVLYTIEDKEILQEKPTTDGCKIVLARWVRKELNNKKQYVTWLLNPYRNTTHQGNYYDKLKEALQNFHIRNS